MISCKFTIIYLFVPAISDVSNCIFCAVDSYICHFPMGHPCLCFLMVILFPFNYLFIIILFLMLVLLFPLFFFFFLFLHWCLLLSYFSLKLCVFLLLLYRWPYPFLDLSSPYSPLWYAVIIYLIITIANTLLFFNLTILCESMHFTLNMKRQVCFSFQRDRQK